MPVFGLVLEGTYDERILRQLIEKCQHEICDFEVRKWAENGGLGRKFHISLEEFKLLGTIDKALVVRDSDGRDPTVLVAHMQTKVAGREYAFPVKFGVAVQEIETWLMADTHAVSAVTGKSFKGPPAPIESFSSPKEHLYHLLLMSGVQYNGDLAQEIASSADIDEISRHSPSFRTFRNDVEDC